MNASSRVMIPSLYMRMSSLSMDCMPTSLPVATTDGHEGFIVDAEVVNDDAEAPVQSGAPERIQEAFGEPPQTMLGDGAYGTTENLRRLTQQGVDLLTPMESPDPQDDNPAKRDDPTQPVAQEAWDQLPVDPRSKRLSHKAFLYMEAQDRYYCPMGHALSYWYDKKAERNHGQVRYRVYRCVDCEGCALASRCIPAKAKMRRIQRDGYEPIRRKIAARMASPDGRKIYRRRAWVAETPFAFIKSVMGIRTFLLRGLANVRVEWDWICTAYNLDKLVRKLARLRAQAVAAMA